MNKNYLFVVAFCATLFCNAQTIFINEIHYNNAGLDVDEGVEISGPAGTNLLGYKIRFYNSSGSLYGTILSLYGTIENQQNNLGTKWFPSAGIQNGPSDGLALIDPSENVIQFLSYEGTTTANEGPAKGMTSVDIGVSESELTPVGYSLQLVGEGSDYSDFTWNSIPIAETRDLPNTGQTLPVLLNQIEDFKVYPNPVLDDYIKIETKFNLPRNLAIYSIDGQQIFKMEYSLKDVINLSTIPAGVYILNVEEDGRITQVKLVIN